MKKIIPPPAGLRKISLALALAASLSVAGNAQQVKESLNRAPVAVCTKQGILVSWRALTADEDGLTFKVLRNGKVVAQDIANVTNYLDADGQPGDVYTVETSYGMTEETTAWDNMFTSFDVKSPSPIKTADGSGTGRYRPDDMSVGDLDGDGEYEIVLKWFPDNQRDSGKDGKSSPTLFTAYELDGTPLWEREINIGWGIRTGNHDVQFLVYDFDGDGKAELICQTAAGSKDATGKYVSEVGDDDIRTNTDNTDATVKSYVNSKGRVTNGEEFLTVFEGKTGKALRTVWYNPNRAMKIGRNGMNAYSGSWGDSSHNRGHRFNACVAYLDGLDKLPSAIMERGYYTFCFLWAVDWDGKDLKTRWLHKGSKGKWEVFDAAGNVISSGEGKSSYAQGVHGISVGDTNEDGKDEILTGGATIGPDGKLLCSTGFGHGDAIHLADLCPDRPGLEIMMPHEESPFGYDVHDATTGDTLVSATSAADNGRGLAADFIPANRGFEFWSSAESVIRDCATGKQVLDKKPDTNFRIYWSGDPYDQTFDGRYDSNTQKCAPRIRTYNSASGNITTLQEFASFGSPSTCNTTKATPCLQADILGDWREELIMFEYESDWSSPTCRILIYSTPQPTNYKVPCLMEDHLYRMGVAWQNSSYNQPPHLGYYLPDFLGVDGATYRTQVTSYAPEAKPAAPKPTGEEKLVMPAADKGVIKGVCYTAGENGEITASQSGEYIKIRTGNNDELVFSVNEGYIITSITVTAYSNNKSTAADRSIIMTGLYVDGSESTMLQSNVTFKGGTAGQDPTTVTVSDLNATDKIVLSFDNSNIVSGDVDSAGKNKQIMAIVTFTWKRAQSTAIGNVGVEKGVSSQAYDLQGRPIAGDADGLYIQNGKLVIKR